MKGNCGECQSRWYCDIDPDKCNAWPDPIPQTNADHIRSMSDEELAVLWSEPFCDRRTTPECRSFHGDCSACVLDWLEQPYKEDK